MYDDYSAGSLAVCLHDLEFASDDAPHMFAVRLRHRQMNESAVNLKRIVATPCEIDELIGNHECAGLNLLSETAHYARPDHMPHAKRLQCREIRLVRNLVRRNRMLRAMSRQKSDMPVAQFANADRSGRFPVGSFCLDVFRDSQSRQRAETRSADNSNEWFLLGGWRLLVLLTGESR